MVLVTVAGLLASSAWFDIRLYVDCLDAAVSSSCLLMIICAIVGAVACRLASTAYVDVEYVTFLLCFLVVLYDYDWVECVMYGVVPGGIDQ